MRLRNFNGTGLGGSSKEMVTLTLLSCSLAFVGVCMASGGSQGAERDNRAAFVGTWKGICEDKKPFVILILREEKGQIVGTLSIGNMHGNVDGGCEEVVDEPTPEHAQQIHDVKVGGSTLSFSWGTKVGYQVAKFQMNLVGIREAELKFLGTPAENNPWKVLKE